MSNVHDWLDDFHPDVQPPAGADDADLLIAHALIRHASRDDAARAQDQARLERAVNALHDDAPAVAHPVVVSRQPRAHRRLRAAPWAIAATLLLTVGLWWIAAPESTANAALLNAIEASERPIDRSYTITIESQPGAPIAFRKQAALDVRGSERFVLRRPTPLGADIIIGSNGRQSWFVSPLGDVTVRDGSELIDGWNARRDAMLPFHNVQAALDYLTEHYELTLLNPQPLTDDGPALLHLRGQRRPNAGLGPTDVEVWCDPDTSETHRLILHLPDQWSPSGHPVRVTFDLESTTSLPDAWYEPESHE